MNSNTDAKVLKAKLLSNWTGPYKILAVGPCSVAETPDSSPLGSNLLYLDLSSDLPGADASRRVAIERCKPCFNPHDIGDMPKYLSAGLTQYVLYNFSKKSPPYDVSQGHVSTSLQPLEVEQIGHQSVRGRGGVIAVLYRTRWSGFSEPSWEREIDLHLSRCHIMRYWAGTPDQHLQTTASTDECGSGGTTRALPQQRGMFPSAGLCLCSPRPLAPSLPRHGIS